MSTNVCVSSGPKETELYICIFDLENCTRLIKKNILHELITKDAENHWYRHGMGCHPVHSVLSKDGFLLLFFQKKKYENKRNNKNEG